MKIFTILLLVLGFAGAAQADIWKWVDVNGDVHFVSSMKPIFTWVDEQGDVHYADSPGHEDAVAVQLVWVSTGSVAETQAADSATKDKAGSGQALEGETPAQRAEREQAEAYYCKRATEIYDSYLNAPRLYKTNGDGEREYLSEEEAAQTIAETRAKTDEACK